MQRSARYSKGLKPRTMKDRKSAGFCLQKLDIKHTVYHKLQKIL